MLRPITSINRHTICDTIKNPIRQTMKLAVAHNGVRSQLRRHVGPLGQLQTRIAQRRYTVTTQSQQPSQSQSQHSHSTVTAQSRHSHITVTSQSQHSHSTVTAQSQHSHSTSTAQHATTHASWCEVHGPLSLLLFLDLGTVANLKSGADWIWFGLWMLIARLLAILCL